MHVLVLVVYILCMQLVALIMEPVIIVPITPLMQEQKLARAERPAEEPTIGQPEGRLKWMDW